MIPKEIQQSVIFLRSHVSIYFFPLIIWVHGQILEVGLFGVTRCGHTDLTVWETEGGRPPSGLALSFGQVSRWVVSSLGLLFVLSLLFSLLISSPSTGNVFSAYLKYLWNTLYWTFSESYTKEVKRRARQWHLFNWGHCHESVWETPITSQVHSKGETPK